MDLAAGEHPGEHALVGHDALAGLLLDDAIIVALFADLGHFQHHIPDGKPAGHRQIAKIEALDDQIFAEGTVVHPDLLAESLDFFGAEHTDLTVPVAAVGVLHDAPLRGQDGAGHLGFYGAPLGAGADCQKLTHSYLSSNAIHPAGSGHGTIVKMVFPGLCPDGLPDSGQQLRIVRAAAQQCAQVAPGLAGKAGA